MKPLKILIDNREKTPWLFENIGYNFGTLKTGDYSIEGLEDIVSIERKSKVSELAGCIYTKRFANEMERLSSFKYKYLVFEFPRSDIEYYPYTSDIPKARWSKIRIHPAFIFRLLKDFVDGYEIEIVYCDDRSDAMQKVEEILRDVYKKECGNKPRRGR